MKILIPIIGLFFSVMAAAQNAADPKEQFFPKKLTAHQLLNLCAASSLTVSGRSRKQFCGGFISGVEESLRLLREQTSLDETPAICLPDEEPAARLSQRFVKYAAGRADLDQPAVAVVIDALKAAYPCQR